MRSRGAWLWLAWALCAPPSPASDAISFGRLGEVRLFHPARDARDVVLLFSPAQGWDAASTALAHRMSGAGALVGGVDTKHLLAELEKSGEKCVSLPVEGENLSHYLQSRAGLRQYLQPSLAGIGAGASLAYATLVAAPADLFKGALSVEFCPQLELKKPLCKGQGLLSAPRRDRAASGRQQRQPPVSALPRRLLPDCRTCPAAET